MSRSDTKILIVEDYQDAQEILELALQGMGYTTRAASDRDAAYQILLDFKPDLILMDYRMNGMSLDQFIVAARKIAPGLHFVLLSANADDEAKRYNVKYWLRKPFDPVELENMVAECLRGGSSALMPAVK